MDWDDLRPNLTKTANKYFEKVQARQRYCVYCQPYDGGEPVWIFGEQQDLEDLYDDLNVPEQYRDQITDYLRCPHCGRDGFDRHETIGLEDPGDVQISLHVRRATGKFRKSIEEFRLHLEKYPTLGLAHPFGRKLHKEIGRRVGPTCSVTGEYWRARVVASGVVFETPDLHAPPVGVAGEGRYHHAGQSVLYLASGKDSAIREVIGDDEKYLVWVQEYSVGDIDNVLDLRGDWNELGPSTDPLFVAVLSNGLLNRKVEDQKSTWKPQYQVSKFVADCARLAGYRGIQYNGVRGYADNVVLFEPKPLPIQPKGRPQIVIYEKKELTDFSGPPI